nr:unnamed protein product [Callosobruchus analis]
MSSRTRKIMNMLQTSSSAPKDCSPQPDSPTAVVTERYVVSFDGILDRVDDDLTYGYLHTNETIMEELTEKDTAAADQIIFDLSKNVESIGEAKELEDLGRNLHSGILHASGETEAMKNVGNETDFQCIGGPYIVGENKEVENEAIEDFENREEAIECGEERSQSGNTHSDELIETEENDIDSEPIPKRSRVNRLETKLKRVRGKDYEGYRRNKEKNITRTAREAKTIKARCSHKAIAKITKKSFLCASITDEDRQNIFRKLWKLNTWNEKKLFIRYLIITRPIRRRRRETKDKSSDFKKNEGHDYYLTKQNGERLKVCHKMVLNTLSLGEDCVKRWVKEDRLVSESSTDDIGPSEIVETGNKKATRQRIQQQTLRNTVIDWLNLIPKVPSHYCRASSSRQYVDNAFASKQNMYRVYKTWCTENGKEATHLKAFKCILRDEKVSIHKPRKDQCDTCVGFKCGNISEVEYNDHREKEKAGRERKAFLKTSANEENLVLTMDLQSVLTCPRLLASKIHYKLKLQLHNFTIYVLNDKKVALYVWHEANGGVSSNEFTSCVIDYLLSKLREQNKIQSFVLISDGCN